jgi:hexosaminidase
MKSSINFLVVLLLVIYSLPVRGQTSNLLPVPQNVKWGHTKFLIEGAKILVSSELYSRERRSIDQFIASVKQSTGLVITITYFDDSKSHLIELKTEQPGTSLPVPNEISGSQSREAYRLTVTENRVNISARSDAALFYSLITLKQLIIDEAQNSYIPEAVIDDYPEFAYRGVMMDFSHGGLLTEDEIKNQIDFLSLWKMNQYYFYNEVSIEMKGYSLINYNACYSQEQIKRIIAYARERHVDVIPFVNFYGHLHELLRLEKYAGLGIGKYGHDLDPRDQGVQSLLSDWIKQYVEIFPTPFIHVGFDETWETKRLSADDPSIKPKELYLNQLNFVTKTLQGYGKTVMAWTDISNNYPDIISEFPKELIPVIWEYSDNPSSFAKWLKPVEKEKLPFFVQSAVDSWGNVYPACDYTLDNIDLCLKVCHDEKAIGYITSVWTDAVQPLLRNTWLFMAYGSAGAWNKNGIDRKEFINTFCRIMYPKISSQMSNCFRYLDQSETSLAKCLGQHTLEQMWDDPFSSYHLKNTNSHLEDYKNARIAAETAQEYLEDALHTKNADTAFIKTLLVNSRLLDYTAARFIWASTIVDRWNLVSSIKSKEEKDNLKYYDINYSTHGLTIDMMDYCTEIKEEYRKAWLSENMTYRMGTILGRFDSEYLLWRNMYVKIGNYIKHSDGKDSGAKFEKLFLNPK